MNENINLCEILKDCPIGTKFYSYIFGEETYYMGFSSYQGDARPIVIHGKYGKGQYFWLSRKGHPYADNCGECCIFPSKEQRDWSKFTAPWYNKEESIKPKFKVGDIIRHKETNKNDVYKISKVYDDSYGIVGFNWGIYIKYQDQYELAPNKFDPKTLNPFDKVLACFDNQSIWCCGLFSCFIGNANLIRCCGEAYYKYCIPYNNETKHLVGTTGEAPEYYKYWED